MGSSGSKGHVAVPPCADGAGAALGPRRSPGRALWSRAFRPGVQKRGGRAAGFPASGAGVTGRRAPGRCSLGDGCFCGCRAWAACPCLLSMLGSREPATGEYRGFRDEFGRRSRGIAQGKRGSRDCPQPRPEVSVTVEERAGGLKGHPHHPRLPSSPLLRLCLWINIL